MKKDDFALSLKCIKEAINITKGHHETWVKQENSSNVFDSLKHYGVPYGYDFSNEEVLEKNKKNLNIL